MQPALSSSPEEGQFFDAIALHLKPLNLVSPLPYGMINLMNKKIRRKLKRLDIAKGLRGLKSPTARSHHNSTTLPGRELSTEAGPLWIVKHFYPADYQHGAYPLGQFTRLPSETLDILDNAECGTCPAFLDTETTGLSGGAGTLAFLTGVGIWEAEGLRLHQIFLRDPAEEKAAMQYLAEILTSATSLVTFNGRTFDLPLLQTRFILQRLQPRWQQLPHIDLLTVARKLWRDHLPSRCLSVLEKELLSITRTTEDLPGALIPAAYRDYLRTGATGEITRILYHNQIDILSLVTLLTHAAQLLEAPETIQLAATEWSGVGRLYQAAQQPEEALIAWQQALAADTLPPDTAARLWRKIGLRHKRAEEWSEALTSWQQWSERLPAAVEPHIERAKYYEWQTKELSAALAETEVALKRATKWPAGLKRARELAEIRHRYERLQRKIKAQTRAIE